MTEHFLLLSILSPVFAALLIPMIFRVGVSEKLESFFALIFSAFSGVAVLLCWFKFPGTIAFFENRETYSWLPDLSIHLDLGLDGISAPFVLLYCIVFPLFIVFVPPQGFRRQLNIVMLLLCQSFCLGLILSLDLFFIFFFWTAISLPVYFMMTLGRVDEDGRPGFHFIILSSLSSALLFLSFAIIYFLSQPHTFSLATLMGGVRSEKEVLFFGGQFKLTAISFYLFLLAVFFRVPMFLMSGWHSYIFSRSGYLVSGLYGSVLVPVGLYLFFKVGYMLFPSDFNRHASLLFYIGLTGFIIGTICTLANVEVKKALSYFVLAHVSVVIMGITSLDPAGITGGVLHVFSMAIIFSGLYMVLLAFLGGDKHQSDGKIISSSVLIYFALFIFVSALFFAPGTAGFVSFSQVFMGVYGGGIVFSVLLLAGAFIMTLSGFWLYRITVEYFLSKQELGAVPLLRKLSLTPLVFISLFIGLYPKILVDFIRPVALTLLSIAK